jgi:osmotically-inducible protein OsmY
MRLTTFLAIAGLLTLVGCSNWGSQSTTRAANFTDSDLERAIKTQLATDTSLPASDIKVDADAAKNQATLSGTVHTEQERIRAVDLAKAARPGLTVEDKIDVKPRELSRADYTEDLAREEGRKATSTGDKIGSSIDDAWIHSKISSKLFADKDTPSRKINVDVNDNVVTLRGEVESQTSKMEAERIAKETEGVKRVVNRLIVKAG